MTLAPGLDSPPRTFLLIHLPPNLIRIPMRLSPPELQVALDIDSDIRTIADLAARVHSAGVGIIEAGTPAIKRHGADSLIPALRRAAPGALIAADFKTMDAGDLEARIAFRAGADILAVLAIGNDEKVAEAMDEALRWDRLLLIDLIDCPNPTERIMQLKELLGPASSRTIFCFHIGISLQRKGMLIADKLEAIRLVKEAAHPCPLAVAGGIREGVAGDLVRAGADICIVGSAIYSSADPAETARKILAEMRSVRPRTP